jgi:hypothetical protein
MSTIPTINPNAAAVMPLEHNMGRLGGMGAGSVGRSLNASLPNIRGMGTRGPRFPMPKSYAATTSIQGDSSSGGAVLEGPIPVNGLPGLGGAAQKSGLSGIIQKITSDKKLLIGSVIGLLIVAFVVYKYVLKRGKKGRKKRK